MTTEEADAGSSNRGGFSSSWEAAANIRRTEGIVDKNHEFQAFVSAAAGLFGLLVGGVNGKELAGAGSGLAVCLSRSSLS